jgi:hypothetical protein
LACSLRFVLIHYETLRLGGTYRNARLGGVRTVMLDWEWWDGGATVGLSRAVQAILAEDGDMIRCTVYCVLGWHVSPLLTPLTGHTSQHA